MLPTKTLSSLIEVLDRQLDRFVNVRHWQWRVVWSCLIFSILHMVLLNPSCLVTYQGFFDAIRSGQEFDAFKVVKAQAATFYTDLGFSHFNKAAYESAGHLAKLQYRLLEPAIVATLGIERVSLTLWLIQILLSFLFVLLVVKLTYRLTQDRVISLLFTLAISLLYPVRSAWLDMTAYGDFFAYLFLLIAIYTRKPLVVLLVLQAAFWTDERTIPGAGFVLLWHLFQTRNLTKPFIINMMQVAVLGSVILYGALRFWLSVGLGVSLVNTIYLSEFQAIYYENFKLIGFKIWSGFQGAWLLIGLATALLLYNRRFLDAFLLVGMLIVTVNLSFIVGDVNRAISYSYIALFCAFLSLTTLTTPLELRRILQLTVASLLIAPLPNRLRILLGHSLM